MGGDNRREIDVCEKKESCFTKKRRKKKSYTKWGKTIKNKMSISLMSVFEWQCSVGNGIKVEFFILHFV